jgi:hypothetical protein
VADYIGSSGTLIGTALESLGYYYQSYILDTFDAVLFGPLAVGLFVLASILALVNYALTGKAKMVGWALVGPALMAGVLLNRTETKGSVWMFGTKPRMQAVSDYQVNKFLKNNNPPKAKVSSFFASYTGFVSSIIRSLVAVISETKPDIDARFLIRAELATMVRSSQIEDAGLRLLLHDVFYRECGSLVEVGRDLRDKGFAETTRVEMEGAFTQLLASEVKVNGLSKDYMASLLARYTSLQGRVIDQTTREIAQWIQTGGGVIPDSIPEEATAQYQSRKTDAIKYIEQDRKNVFTCQQIWNFVYVGMYQSASLVRQVAQEKGKAIDQNQLVKDLLEVRISESPNLPNPPAVEQAQNLHYLNRVIASYILRNEANRPSGAAFMNNYSNKGFEFTTLKGPTESDLSHLERLRLKSQEWSNKTGIIATAANLPYYQGLLLYFLAIVFPFFSLLLVIPGRQNGFIFWCLLWIWAKSWDVGFAIVMLLDDVLFSIFTYWRDSKGIAYGEGFRGMSPDLADTLSALETLDPTFQLSQYYSIIGTAMASIPMLASYLILGSVKGGAAIIAEGSKAFVAQFTSAAQSGESQPFVTGAKVDAFGDEQKNAAKQLGATMAGGGNTSTPPRASQISSAQGSGTPQNRTGNEQFEDTQRKSIAAGAANGLAGGRGIGSTVANSLPGILGSSPGAARTMRSFLDTVGGGVQTWGKFESALREAGRDREAAMLKAHLDVVSSSVPFDTFQEHKIRKLSAESRIYGMLEIPWTQREGGWGASLQKEITSLTNQKIYEAAPYKAWESVIKGFDGTSKGSMSAMIAFALDSQAKKRNGSGNIADTIVAPPLHEATLRSTNDSFRDGKFQLEFGMSSSGIAAGATGYVYPTNDGVVIYKGKLGDDGQTTGDGLKDVILIRHRNNTIGYYTGHDGDDKLGIQEGHQVSINDPISVLKSKDDTIIFKAIDSHYQWMEVKPMLKGLLPLQFESLTIGQIEFISSQAEKYKPEPGPYPNL